MHEELAEHDVSVVVGRDRDRVSAANGGDTLRDQIDAAGANAEPAGFMASPTSSVAGARVLAYCPPVDLSTSLVAFGLDGVRGETIPLPAGQYTDVRFSPDGTRVATSRNERDNPLAAGADVWLVDLARKSGSRVTFDPQFEFGPVWSPDGRTIYFNSNKTGEYLIYRKSAEGAGEAVAISKPQGLSQTPDDITPDGKLIVFETSAAKTGADLLILETRGDQPPTPYLSTPVNESEARLAPDGRWAAYLSDETGRDELYVQSFPTPGSKMQISNDGAASPEWSRDGKRLFFIAPDQSLMAADVAPGIALRVSAPAKLFRFPRPVSSYDITPDGKRLLATMSASDAAGRSIGVILDWEAAGQ
jgi:dipeptidyl aminopeptidase/acylaminoacyl peptidase